MKFYHFSSGVLGVNTYFLVNETSNEAICIDAGERYELIKNAEREYGFNVKVLLLTHAHFDHSGCAKKLQDDGVKVFISVNDAPKLKNGDNLAADFGKKFDAFTPDYTFIDGDYINACGLTVKALITPGHTDGSATFICENMLFTGDTLFNGGVGRSDFVSGDRNALIDSVKRLFSLDGDYYVYPGHDEFTTLSYEREHNTFYDGD